jgi:hypothetical protein
MQNWQLINNLVEPSDTEGDPASIARRDNIRGDEGQSNMIQDAGFASFSHPKLKFNWTMDINYRDGDSNNLVQGGNLMETLDIPVKTATRPQPTITYTDVNFYNYRTQVATKTDFGTASITMYDDANNKAHGLLQNYLTYVSPMANPASLGLIDNPLSIPFGQLSSIGTIGNANGMIRTIRLHHFYVRKGKTMRMTFTYMNPKIQNFEYDDLDMSASDVNTLTMTFNYDGFFTTEEQV